MAGELNNTLTAGASPGSGEIAKPAAPRTDRPVIQMPRAAIWVLAVAVLAPWLWLALTLRHGAEGSYGKHPPSTSIRPGLYGRTVRCNPGPWGELEYTRILIEPPEEFIPSRLETSKEIWWFFKGCSRETVERLWRSEGLAPPDAPAVAWRVTAGGTWLRPSKEFILGMGEGTRARVYTELSAWPENASQYAPYRFRADTADEWFAGSELSTQTVALAKRLLYRRGTSLCFSDDDIVLPMLGSAAERTALLKTLARKSTLLLKLRIKHDSDINALTHYWGKGNRSKDVKPLLQSLALHPDGMKLDVAHLLPRNARMLLYTYPLPPSTAEEPRRDCHWTSLNFLNLEPDERFLDPKVFRKTIETDYYVVPGEMTFGDVLLFFRPDNTIVHSCVYIADNIVFTKNGTSFAMPWLLMTLPDVQSFYASDESLQVFAFRLKRG